MVRGEYNHFIQLAWLSWFPQLDWWNYPSHFSLLQNFVYLFGILYFGEYCNSHQHQHGVSCYDSMWGEHWNSHGISCNTNMVSAVWISVRWALVQPWYIMQHQHGVCCYDSMWGEHWYSHGISCNTNMVSAVWISVRWALEQPWYIMQYQHGVCCMNHCIMQHQHGVCCMNHCKVSPGTVRWNSHGISWALWNSHGISCNTNMVSAVWISVRWALEQPWYIMQHQHGVCCCYDESQCEVSTGTAMVYHATPTWCLLYESV